MSTPASRWIDRQMEDALDRAFDRIDGYQRDGYCTAEDVHGVLVRGYGDDIADAWIEWIEDNA